MVQLLLNSAWLGLARIWAWAAETELEELAAEDMGIIELLEGADDMAIEELWLMELDELADEWALGSIHWMPLQEFLPMHSL